MRWLTTLATLAGLATLGTMAWQAEGPQLLEKLHLDFFLPIQAESTIDADTLVELCNDDTFLDNLNWKVDAKLQRSAFAELSSSNSRAFVGGGASDAETHAAMAEFQRRIDNAAIERQQSNTPRNRSSVRPSQSRTNPAPKNINDSRNDYKRVPRMQKFGLTNTQRFGNLNPFGKRDMFDRTRFGQQQREIERLRARHDQHVGGNVVYKE